MSQPCLSGMCCCDMILRSEASRHGLESGCACNANDPGCGAPDNSGRALLEWNECADDTDLDFAFDQRFPLDAACVPNLMAREPASIYAPYRVLAAKATDIGGIVSDQPGLVRRWRVRYGVGRRTWLLVHQESRDKFQEKLWERLRASDSFDIFRNLGSRVVFVAPGFSVYDDGTMCEVRQVLNLRRSLLEAARANRAGLISVPTIGWNAKREQDIAFLSAWCERQGSRLSAIAVNAQTGTLSRELILLASGMARIEAATHREYMWIAYGGRQRIERLTEFIPRHRLIQVARRKDFQVPIQSRTGQVHVQYSLLNGVK